MDVVGQMMAYENGELDAQQTIEFFARLVKFGTVWSLQGSYGRMATALIEAGAITADGEVVAL